MYNKIEGKDILKRGIAVALKNAIQFACDALISFYLMYRPNVNPKEKKEIADSIKEFLEQFNRIKSIAFGNIGEINFERRAINRAAEVLLTKDHVKDWLISKFGQSPVQGAARPYSTRLINNSLTTIQSVR